LLRSRRFWIGAAVSAVFLGLFLYNTDFDQIGDAFTEANYVIAFASLPVYFIGIWFRTMRWQYLLRPVKRVSVTRLYPVAVVGLMANNVIPARAGEIVRAWVLGEREKVSKAASLGTIAVDRVFDGLTLVPLLVVIIIFEGSSEEFPLPVVDATINLVGLAIIMAVLFCAALVVLLVLAFSEAWQVRAERLVVNLTPASLRPRIEGLVQSFILGLHSLRSPADLTVAWVLSGVSWMLEATMYYIVALAFDIHVGFHFFLLVTAAANLAISVIASSGGIGPFELVTKQVFIAASVAESGATAYAIGLHTLVLLPVIAVGFYFLGTMGFSFGEMFRHSSVDEAAEKTPDEIETMHAALHREEAPRT
jgi:uncharacterized protein (TIRG00374 family)